MNFPTMNLPQDEFTAMNLLIIYQGDWKTVQMSHCQFKKKIMKHVSELFDRNVFSETQVCTNAKIFIFATLGFV